MIRYVTGNLFDLKAQVLVNPVNTVGVMGAGIAKEFKGRFPRMFEDYVKLCKTGKFKPGELYLFVTLKRFVLNFPTKRDWRDMSKIEDIELGLKKFVVLNKELRFQSCAFPKLGCGLGGLDWNTEVRPLMERYLSRSDVDIEIYV